MMDKSVPQEVELKSYEKTGFRYAYRRMTKADYELVQRYRRARGNVNVQLEDQMEDCLARLLN